MSARSRRLLTALLTLAAVLLIAAPAPAAAPRPATGPVRAGWGGTPFTIIAHRCNGSVYTETTSVGCVKAAAKGATFLDGDIRFTSTDNPVMLHNEHLGIFGAPTVMIRNVSTTAASKYVSASNQNLMTLTQFRDTAVATDSDLSLEPKVRPTAAQWDKVDAILAPVKSRVFMNSFDPRVLADARARGYTWLGLSTADDPRLPLPAGVDVVVEQAAKVDAGTVRAVTATGVEVWCYACETPASWDAMAAAGVTGFATNQHDDAQAWARAYTP